MLGDSPSFQLQRIFTKQECSLPINPPVMRGCNYFCKVKTVLFNKKNKEIYILLNLENCMELSLQEQMRNDGNYSGSIYSFHGEQQKEAFKLKVYLIMGRYKKGWLCREHMFQNIFHSCSRTVCGIDV